MWIYLHCGYVVWLTDLSIGCHASDIITKISLVSVKRQQRKIVLQNNVSMVIRPADVVEDQELGRKFYKKYIYTFTKQYHIVICCN